MLRIRTLFPSASPASASVAFSRRVGAASRVRLHRYEYASGCRGMATPAGGVTGPLTDKIKEDHEEVRLSPPLSLSSSLPSLKRATTPISQ